MSKRVPIDHRTFSGQPVAIGSAADLADADLTADPRRVMFDPETGLPGEALLRDRLEQALARALRDNHSLGVLVIGCEGLAPALDELDLDAAKLAWAEVTERLLQLTRADNTTARLDDGRFAMVLARVRTPDDAALVARRVLQALEAPVTWNSQRLALDAVVGVAFHPDDGQTSEALLHAAAAGLRQARANRCGYRFRGDG
ncbi:MAG: diguanylate cyclase [Proteobacteria bacterium]|nr:diguanylate cyclase [Pseudomonadota bacterium]